MKNCKPLTKLWQHKNLLPQGHGVNWYHKCTVINKNYDESAIPTHDHSEKQLILLRKSEALSEMKSNALINKICSTEGFVGWSLLDIFREKHLFCCIKILKYCKCHAEKLDLLI